MRILCTVDRHFDTIANRESVTLGRGSLTSTSARAISRHPARFSSGAMSPLPDLEICFTPFGSRLGRKLVAKWRGPDGRR